MITALFPAVKREQVTSNKLEYATQLAQTAGVRFIPDLTALEQVCIEMIVFICMH